MEKTLIFRSVDEIRLKKLLRFIIPTYLTSLFTTVYTIVDGIFVSAYVGTNALAAINVVYPLVNILYGIALAFATGGSALAALLSLRLFFSGCRSSCRCLVQPHC